MGSPHDVPPSDIDSEYCAVGSCIILPTILDELLLIVRPDDFVCDATRELLEGMLALNATGKSIDTTTIAAELKRRGSWESIGGAGFVAKVARSVPHAHHFRDYADNVKRMATRRRFLKLADDIQALAQDDQCDVESLAASVNSATTKALEFTQQTQDGMLGDTVLELSDKIVQGGYQALRGINTQFPSINRLAGGIRAGVTVIGARPSLGKTASADSILEYIARTTGRTVGLFSLEMLREEKAGRFIAMTSGVIQDRWTSLNTHERESISNSAAEFCTRNILIDDRACMRVGDICAQTRVWSRKHDLACIGIDYLQLIEPDNRKDSRQQQIGAISRQLKMLSMELGIPILLLSQLNREADGQRPSLRHLREAGDIEQDADNVWFLWKHEAEAASPRRQSDRWTKPKEPEQKPVDRNGIEEVTLTIAKNRNGKRDIDINLLFHGPEFRFEEVPPPWLKDREAEAEFERSSQQQFGNWEEGGLYG